MILTAIHTTRQRHCSHNQLDLDLSGPTSLVSCSCCGAPIDLGLATYVKR